jgi:type II secretory pathway pseudopilin PulG
MTTNNKKGMTLVEVLVYIVLAAMLLAPVIMLVQNSSVTMARDASNVSLRMTGRELLNTIYDDLRNTGYKLDPDNFEAKDEAIINDDDDSSILPGATAGDPLFDTLTVLMGRLYPPDYSNAALRGKWQHVDTITYKVEGANKELKRILRNQETQTLPDKCKKITLARNVVALKFRYSENMATWYDTETLSGSAPNIDAKVNAQFIKVIIVQKDPKQLSPTKQAKPITLIDRATPLVFTPTDAALYERHEAVIPIPNNGLFPE